MSTSLSAQAKHARIAAVMYLRASTENQNYSTQHQRASIAEFAAANNLALISEYVDEGRSGLDIRRRHGLQELMRDVQSGAANFKVIVVYDVSRWGRFQDVDEAAYHEHTCRRAGIKVMYCAEQFQNDGSPLAALLKGIKRTMAAEYSRELSAKVFSAQCRFIDMGFKQGGHAGYGLRRLALASDGTPRRELQYGEAKGVTTDRVVLVRGPEIEVATVRRIYSSYVDDRASEASIARMLNFEGVASEFGRPWTFSMVNSILTNLKYIGTLAYNRRSGKLSARRQHNATENWIRNERALPALIAAGEFEAAQAERARRNTRYSEHDLLALLRGCHERNGRVTAPLIAHDPLMPDPQLFVRRFGSLISAYDLAGLPRTRDHAFLDTKIVLESLRRSLFTQVCEAAVRAGGILEATCVQSTTIINGAICVRVVVAPRSDPAKGFQKWAVKPMHGIDFTIVGRHDPEQAALIDFHLLPSCLFNGKPIYLQQVLHHKFAGTRFLTVADMFCSSRAQNI